MLASIQVTSAAPRCQYMQHSKCGVSTISSKRGLLWRSRGRRGVVSDPAAPRAAKQWRREGTVVTVAAAQRTTGTTTASSSVADETRFSTGAGEALTTFPLAAVVGERFHHSEDSEQTSPSTSSRSSTDLQ